MLALILALSCGQLAKCPHCGTEFMPTPPPRAADDDPILQPITPRDAARSPISAAVTHRTKTVPPGTPISWVYLIDKQRFALGHQRPSGFWEYRPETMKHSLSRSPTRMVPIGYSDDEDGRIAYAASAGGVPDSVMSTAQPRIEIRVSGGPPRR